jgi:hypothetical protein
VPVPQHKIISTMLKSSSSTALISRVIDVCIIYYIFQIKCIIFLSVRLCPMLINDLTRRKFGARLFYSWTAVRMMWCFLKTWQLWIWICRQNFSLVSPSQQKYTYSLHMKTTSVTSFLVGTITFNH